MKKIIVDLQIACNETSNLPTLAQFEQWINQAISHLTSENEVTIRLVDEAESQQLNATFRGKNYPTNVLTFPFESLPEVTLPFLGDIIICRQVVEAEAIQQQKALFAHWAHMVVHGALHLLGYDHLDEEQAEHMESLEKNILQELGYPDPYFMTKDED